MAALTLNIPAEYTGRIYGAAAIVCDVEGDWLREEHLPGGELQEAAEGTGHHTADLRRAVDDIEWFVALGERAEADVVESVLGKAEAAA